MARPILVALNSTWLLLNQTGWVQLPVQPNLTSMSGDRFVEAGFSSQHRLETCWRGAQECDAEEGKMVGKRKRSDIPKAAGMKPLIAASLSLDSPVYFQIHCHGCSSPPGGPPLTNQLPAHLPAGQRPSVAHRWSLPLPAAHRGQDQQGNLPSFAPGPVHTGKPRCYPKPEATQKSLLALPH